MPSADLIPEDYRRWLDRPAVRRFVNHVLDRRDRKGRFPRTITIRETDLSLRDLVTFLPPRCVKPKSGGRQVVSLVQLEQSMAEDAQDLGSTPPSLEAVFDQLVERGRQNHARDRDAYLVMLGQRVQEGIVDGRRRAEAPERNAGRDETALHRFAKQWRTEIDAGKGPWVRLGRETDASFVREAVARLVAGFLIARTPRSELLPLDLLSLRVAGSTKALRPGTEDHRRLVELLLATDGQWSSKNGNRPLGKERIRDQLFLEGHGIVFNEAPLDVFLQGDLRFQIAGDSFDDIGRLARHGIPSRIAYTLLRRVEHWSSTAREVLTVENETAFHLLAHGRQDRLVVYTGGQASYPLVQLLVALARDLPHLDFAHTGDLDRAGLLILRSLRQRTGLDIQTRWMDVPTFDAHREHGLPLGKEERQQIKSLRTRWNEPFGAELLARIEHTGVWVEQERVVEAQRDSWREG